MSEFPTVAPGADVAALLFNSRWINHVTQRASAAAVGRSNGSQRRGPAWLPLDVLNDTGADINVPYPILRLTTPVVTVDDNASAPYNDADFKGDTPNADTAGSFVVVQGPIKAAVARPAALIGLTWCKVDVASESDTHATAIDGDNTKLQSGSSGVEIKWKESGTGEKWALVLLGGGGSGDATPDFGQLVDECPPGLLESNKLKLESWDRPGFSPVLDESDAQVEVWPENPNLYSTIRGSDAVPVRVWGKRYTLTREEPDPEDEEATITVSHECFLIYGVLDKLASTVGHTATPDNGKGQALITVVGSSPHADKADGANCGGA